MQSKRQKQKAETRERIIRTAYQVYAQQGFSATTASIAKEAQVSHGAIFVHFPTLDDLIGSLVADFARTLGEEIHGLVEASGSMEDLLKVHLGVLSRYEGFYTRLIAEGSLLPEDAKLSFANMQSVFAFHFSKVVEREQENQHIKNIPVHLLFNTWMGLIHYYLMNKELFAPEKPLLERYGTELIETYLKLISNENRRHPL